MIAIYTDSITPRLQYTLNLVFKTVLGIDYVLLTDKQTFSASSLPKISYSKEKVSDEIHFFATSLLFENNIQPQTICVTHNNGLPIFFQHHHNDALSFDAFAMIFYLVSRYEEYVISDRDEHGRFTANLSIAYQHNFLQIPLVNHLCLKIQSLLTQQYPQLNFPKQQFQFLPTYDIDFAWSFLNKGLKRTTGAYVRALLKGNIKEIAHRITVQLGLKTDPFFTFSTLNTFHLTHRLSPIYFFLIGDYGTFDKNIAHDNRAFQQLIQHTAARYNIGVHPSYISNQKPQQITTEIERLTTITNQNIIRSRQHFLKLSLPTTYRNLLQNGILEDYTMGYATEVGFRASIATPYFWYDLENEKPTALQIIPFQVMDVTLSNYLKLDLNASRQLLQNIINNTKAVNGLFSTLWHNNNINSPLGQLYINDLIKML
jgi:hypothetical protein